MVWFVRRRTSAQCLWNADWVLHSLTFIIKRWGSLFCFLKCRFYGDCVITITWSQSHDLGSTPTFFNHIVVSLDKVLYNDYLCLVASNKKQIQWWEVKNTTEKLENSQLLSGCGFIQNIVPLLLSHDRRIKMEQNK